jgi:hypothetical protein
MRKTSPRLAGLSHALFCLAAYSSIANVPVPSRRFSWNSGVPLGWSGSTRGYYVGLDLGALWPLVKRAPIHGPNKVFRLLEQRTFLGPMLRYRREDMQPRALDAPFVVQHDLTLGLQMRVMIGTDLF